MPTLAEIAASIYRGVFGEEPNSTQVRAISAWVGQERPRPLSVGTFTNNPLNTTLAPKDLNPLRSSGVQAFPTLANGIEANVRTLIGSYYNNVRATLKALGNGGSTAPFFQSLKDSPWDGGFDMAQGHYKNVDFSSAFSGIDLSLPWEDTTVLPPAEGPSGTWNIPGSTPPGVPSPGATPSITDPPMATSPGGDVRPPGNESLLDMLLRLLKDGDFWRKVGLTILAAVLIMAGFALYVKGWVPSLNVAGVKVGLG